MKRIDKFIIPPTWKVLLHDLGIDTQVALSYAELPHDLFDLEKIQLTADQYFQLWCGIEQAAQEKGIELALALAQVMSFESFSAPILAAMCSRNLNSALKRLQEYKPLIGPMTLDVSQTEIATEVTLSCYGHTALLPRSVSLMELTFFTQLSRLATRQHIQPIKIELPELPINLEKYGDYFGCDLVLGKQTKIAFSASDAEIPFLTNNQTLLKLFQHDIEKELSTLTQSKTVSTRVYDHLMILLPQGKSSIDIVASNMAMSKRTLQRKLTLEEKSFNAILNQVREDLATYYLTKTDLEITEITFLIGFQETNSLIRAYTGWTGRSPRQMRYTL